MAHPLTAGLDRVLNINLDFIVHFKRPLLINNDAFGDDKKKIYTCTKTCMSTLPKDYAKFDFSTLSQDTVGNRMWILLPDDIRKRRIIHFDVKFWTIFNSRGHTYGTDSWEEKQKLIENLVDVQLLSTSNANDARSNGYKNMNIKDINIYQDYLKSTLSFEANLLRGDILSWIYKRMAEDYKAEIDAKNGCFAQYPAGFDFGISLINSIKNLTTPSSSSRALIKVGGKTSMMTTSSDGDEDGVDMNEYRLDNISFFAPIVRKYCRYSIAYIMESIEKFKDKNVLKDLIPETEALNNNIVHYCTSLTEKFNNQFMEFYIGKLGQDDSLWSEVSFLFDANFYLLDLVANSIVGEGPIYPEKWEAFYNYYYTNHSMKQFNAIVINKCTDSVVRAKLLEGLENKNFEVINIKLNLPPKVLEGFSYSMDNDNRLSSQIVIDATKNTIDNKTNISTKITLALEKMFTPFAEMNKSWWNTIFSLDNIGSFLANNLPDFLETSKLFTEWRRSQIFYGLDAVKRDFERLSDVSSNVISDKIAAKNRAMFDVNRTKYYDATDGLTKGLFDLVIHTQSSGTDVDLYWSSVNKATKYKVYKDGSDVTPTNLGNKTKTAISSLKLGETYKFYVTALDANDKVIAQSNTVKV